MLFGSLFLILSLLKIKINNGEIIPSQEERNLLKKLLNK